jgi:hypothetical protein
MPAAVRVSVLFAPASSGLSTSMTVPSAYVTCAELTRPFEPVVSDSVDQAPGTSWIET